MKRVVSEKQVAEFYVAAEVLRLRRREIAALEAARGDKIVDHGQGRVSAVSLHTEAGIELRQ